MTQLKGATDSLALEAESSDGKPKDSQSATSELASQVLQPLQTNQTVERSSSLISDAPDPDYRPPEAVPITEPGPHDWFGSESKWAERDTSHEWGGHAASNDWSSADQFGWTDNSKPLVQPWELSDSTKNANEWASLRVIGTDNPTTGELERWWDPEVQRAKRNLGPGMLAPLALETIHDTNHVLYEVSFPDTPTPEPAAALSPKSSVTVSGALNSSVATTASATPASPAATTEAPAAAESVADAAVPHVPPTVEERRSVMPHPAAYYCRRHHGWVILSINAASSSASHLNAHWCSDPEKQTLLNELPDSSLRMDKSCLDSDSAQGTTTNAGWNATPQPEKRMHHFHRYSNVIAGSGLYPAMKYRALFPPSHPAISVPPKLSEDVEMNPEVRVVQDDAIRADWEKASPSDHFDLYLCCQCKAHIICSPNGSVIPGVIPLDALESFIREKSSNPKPGQAKEQSAFTSLEMMLRIVEEPLWFGNQRSLTINGRAFAAKIGWNETTRQIFEAMGFVVEDNRLTPPSLDPKTPEGRVSRQRLLRVWVEMGAVLADYHGKYPKLNSTRKNCIRLRSARDIVSERLGADHDKIPRVEDITTVTNIPQKIWDSLGITRSIATPDVIEAAYRYQLRCDPPQTPIYYDAICVLSRQSQLPNVSVIKTLVATEESKGRWSYEDLQKAANELGFGVDGIIQTEYIPEEASDDYLLAAFDQAFKSTINNAAKRTIVKNSLRILAESRASEVLMKRYEQVSLPGFMDIDEAYRVLEVSKEVDEDTLVVVYQVRVEDSPYSKERMKAALTRVAEDRNSTRLKALVETGTDPGKPPVVVPQDFPRGLQQLGNTCYLNSLLQYFYTIRELREVIEGGNFDLDVPISDEELLKHRIGGRLVSRHEVERSRKFVKLLSGLFMQMMCADEAAITPEIELAKLALVTSKDEEEDAIAQKAPVTAEPGELVDNPTGTSGQVGTIPEVAHNEIQPTKSFDTRPTDRVGESQDLLMESRPVSPPIEVASSRFDEEDPMQQSQPEPTTIAVPAGQVEPLALDEDSADPQADISGDSMIVEMGDDPVSNDGINSEAIIAARKKSTMIPDSGAMMFGKQHDVSEVFDNCMFQIETALRFQIPEDGDEGGGMIKKLFYGKLLQILRPIADPTASPTTSKARATVHEKEDLFSHLLVNVSDEGFDLYDGLSRYFEDEVEHGGRRSKMEVSLLDIPPILQIQLQRVQFNRETMQAFKSNAYVKFEETLAIDRFLANTDPEKKAISKGIENELHACRGRLSDLASTSNPGENNKLVASLSGAKTFLAALKNEHPDIDEELIAHLKGEVISVEEEITQCRSRSHQLKEQLEAFWKDEREAEYQLASVFIHRGTSPSFGHYFFYSRNLPRKPDEWFKYNDSEVTPVPKEEVLADGTGSTANPYLLVYVRKGYDIMDTVHRVTLE